MRGFYLNFPIRQTVSVEFIEKGKSQILSVKSNDLNQQPEAYEYIPNEDLLDEFMKEEKQ